MLGADSTAELSVPLLLAAAGAALVWWAVLAMVVVARRPPRIRGDGEGGLDLPPEPPAVAGLLADDFEVAAETAPAVLLDLAARGYASLEEVQPGRTICRVAASPDVDEGGDRLAAYELRVLTELRSKAVEGVVPADALTTGPDAQSKGWHRALTREVVHDAQARGLTVDRWPRSLVSLLSLGLLVVVACLALSTQVSGDAGDDPTVLGAIAAAVAISGVLAGAATAAALRASMAQLPTDAGRTAARRVVGLATTLRGNESFKHLPPAGVVLWDRLFAYAAVFGTAPLAVGLLPMGAEDDRRAWSSVGGRWRTVRVRYPRAVPPAWGKHPFLAIALALSWGAVAVLVGYGLLQLAEAERPAEIDASAWRWVDLGAALGLVPVLLVLTWCAWVLARAVPDLWQVRTTVGTIVRKRRFRQVFTTVDKPEHWRFLALDEGDSDRIRAWRVREEIWRQVAQGETVAVEVTPRLAYVRSMSPTPSTDEPDA